MISDEVFVKELDGYLKKIGHKYHDARKIMIDVELKQPVENRDSILEWHKSLIPKKETISSEDTEQINFVEWFRKTYPDVVIMAIWNGGTRSSGERAKQIAMGLHPGAADLFIPAWGLWVEMKRTKGWVWKQEQRDFQDYVCSIGQSYILCIGCEDAKAKVLAFIDQMNEKNKND